MIQGLQSPVPADRAVGEGTESLVPSPPGHGLDDDLGDEKIELEKLGAPGHDPAQKGRRRLLKEKSLGGERSVQGGADGPSLDFDRGSLKGSGGEAGAGGAIPEKGPGFFPVERSRPVRPDVQAQEGDEGRTSRFRRRGRIPSGRVEIKIEAFCRLEAKAQGGQASFDSVRSGPGDLGVGMGEENVIGISGIETAGNRGQFAVEAMKVDIEEHTGDGLSGRNAAKTVEEPALFIAHDRADDALQNAPILGLDPAGGGIEKAPEHAPKRGSGSDRDRIGVGVDIAAQNVETPAPGIRPGAAMGSDEFRKPADGVPPGHALSIGIQFRSEPGRGRFIDDFGDDAVDDEIDEPERKDVPALSLNADFPDAAGPEFVGVSVRSPGR